MTKLEKLKEVNESLTTILADLETEIFIKNASIKTKNVDVRESNVKYGIQNEIKNYL